MAGLEDIVNKEKKPEKCSKCGAKLEYRSRGEYYCTNKECGNMERDEFGEIIHFLDEHGPSPAMTISEGTGISITKITEYLKDGRMEIRDTGSMDTQNFRRNRY